MNSNRKLIGYLPVYDLQASGMSPIDIWATNPQNNGAFFDTAANTLYLQANGAGGCLANNGVPSLLVNPESIRPKAESSETCALLKPQVDSDVMLKALALALQPSLGEKLF